MSASPLTTKAAEIRAGLVAELRRAVTTGEDGCGTLPAKEAVKVRPVDWHRITRLAREAAALIEQQAAELAAERQRSDTLRVQRDGHAAELAEKAGIYDEQVTRAGKQWQAWETRATTAESERDELLREKERLGAGWLPIETAPKDGDSYLFHDGVLGTIYGHWYDGDEEEEPCWFFFDWCGDELIGCVPVLWRPVPRASSALENGPAGLADANTKSPAPSSQSERIAVLEAALREKDRVVQLYGKHDKMTDREKIGAIINHPCFDSALTPLGEE